MTNRLTYKVGTVLVAAALFGACSSDDSSKAGVSAGRASSSDTTDTADQTATTGDSPTADTTAAEDATVPGAGADPAAGADDLCSTIPDLATIEGVIGVSVKDPLGVGAAGFQQSCTLLVAPDDFPGVSFTLFPGGTIAGQIEFVKTNFSIDIVPLDGADGFYAGEGNTVYWEGNGNLYQAGATIDGDSRTASLNLLKTWQGL